MSNDLPTFAAPHGPETVQVDLGPVAGFADKTPRVVQSSRGPILVYRESPAVIHVYLAICPHMGNHLREQDCANGTLVCNLHNWEFDLRSGRSLNPGFTAGLLRLEYEVREGRLIVEVPPEAPDPMGR